MPTLRRMIVGLLAANVVAVAAALYLSGVWFPVARASDPLLIFVHAGDVSSAPENTLEAVLAAIEHGADGIEIDVDMSADGTWWLMHSGFNIGPRTTGTGDISDLTDAEIEQLRIIGGLGYRPEMGDRYRIPRLSDVLDAVRDWDGWLYLHNKELTADAARDLARIWADAPFAGKKGVICRTPEVVEATKVAAPELRTLMHTERGALPEATPYLDVWLAAARYIARPDVIALRPYDVEMYMFFGEYGLDERIYIERAYRWGARSFLTWDLARAREIVAELES